MGGLPAGKSDYSPFGNSFPSTDIPEGESRYAGLMTDAESDSIYMRMRHYDPNMGGFLTPDPYYHFGGCNLYQYVGADPVSEEDPFGLFSSEEINGLLFLGNVYWTTGKDTYALFKRGDISGVKVDPPLMIAKLMLRFTGGPLGAAISVESAVRGLYGEVDRTVHGQADPISALFTIGSAGYASYSAAYWLGPSITNAFFGMSAGAVGLSGGILSAGLIAEAYCLWQAKQATWNILEGLYNMGDGDIGVGWNRFTCGLFRMQMDRFRR
jgi:RHS repeat-associated protein